MNCQILIAAIRNFIMFEGKILLITGGTGSFGNEVLEYFLSHNFKEIRIFSRDEKKQDDMRRKYNDNKLVFYIGDVRDYDSVSAAMLEVNYVFHAAALKQVPSCEFYPMEAVKTNIIGADNVMKSAIQNQVERVVILSTDKAVYPINAMGLSKSMMEKLMASHARTTSKTVLCATRYGNVMASRGSVIPLFLDQIKSGLPVTITDPNMTRFLMSLKESVDLVLYAFHHAEPGDIFVQKAPAATIDILAQAIYKITKTSPDIKYIGTRHGEKLYESLISREEMVRSVDLGDYYRIRADNRDLNYSKYFDIGDTSIDSIEDYTSHNTQRLDVAGTIEQLKKLDIIQAIINE